MDLALIQTNKQNTSEPSLPCCSRGSIKSTWTNACSIEESERGREKAQVCVYVSTVSETIDVINLHTHIQKREKKSKKQSVEDLWEVRYTCTHSRTIKYLFGMKMRANSVLQPLSWFHFINILFFFFVRDKISRGVFCGKCLERNIRSFVRFGSTTRFTDRRKRKIRYRNDPFATVPHSILSSFAFYTQIELWKTLCAIAFQCAYTVPASSYSCCARQSVPCWRSISLIHSAHLYTQMYTHIERNT